MLTFVVVAFPSKKGVLSEGYLPRESSLRYLSAAVDLKQIFLTADVTVIRIAPLQEDRLFNRLQMPETIEWE